jgi:hypothetical protein
MIRNIKHWYDEGEDLSLSPHTAPALRGMMTYYLFGGAIATGVKPHERLAVVVSISNENRFIQI